MFRQYIPTFSAELQSIRIENLPLERYPAEYLKLLVIHHRYYLRIYAQVLEKVVQHSARSKEEIVLLDYGAGNGLLGIFAKHCGFKTVYSVDNNESFVQSARFLNRCFHHPVDAILTGDWNTIIHFCKNNPVPDAIVGTDVIERIYDIGKFLKGIKQLSAAAVTVFTTASVTANPFKSFSIKKLQRLDEYKWSNPEHTHSNNPFAGLPFVEARRRIIQQHFSLPPHEAEQLARATRGMKEEDILEAVKFFTNTRQMPQPVQHPTNTCDPVTGSWTEQLITIKAYKKMYNNAGFAVAVFNGFYNEWQKSLKSKLLKVMNRLIGISGRFGTWLSPYILLVGS